MDADQAHGDAEQRSRVDHLLRDPVGYFADARREAREHARQTVLAHLDEPAADRS